MHIPKIIVKKFWSFVGSNGFFWGVVGFLIINALWIAFSGVYPMAFDEDFHLGIIKLYANHPNPFWDGSPVGGGTFGAIARDPSYLYHFLMSFPYRLISTFANDQYTQVMFLRFINIGLFAGGMYVFRQLLNRLRAPSPAVNLALLIYVLIPISPLLAAQINYDNLFIPLTALSLLITIKIIEQSTAKRLDTVLLLSLLAACLGGSLVKYAFLPFLVAILVFLTVYAYVTYKTFSKILSVAVSGFKSASRPALVALVLLNVLLGSLFIERYGINLIRYHKPIADCGEVLDYEYCQNYGPWIRDYKLANRNQASSEGPIAFTQHWAYGMWFRSFFAVDGPGTRFQTRGPLIVPGVSAVVLLVTGLLALAFTLKRILKKYYSPAAWLFICSSAIYIISLWAEEFRLFTETGKPVAINGRYLLPILPMVVILIILAFRELLISYRRSQVVLAVAATMCFAWGGAGLTYVLRSNDAWYWPNAVTLPASHFIQDIAGPITPGYRKPTQFLH